MLNTTKTALRECLVLFESRSSPRALHNAQRFGSGLARRGFATPSPSLIRTSLSNRLASAPTCPNAARSLLKPRGSPLRSTRRNFHNTSRWRDSKHSTKGSSTKEAEPQGLSERLKKLSREYGWAAVGVYLGLSVLDFPFCFLLVRIVGTDKIGEFEEWVTTNAKKLIPQSWKDRWHHYRRALKEAEKENLGDSDISDHVEMAGWGVEEAQARHKAEASLGTQLALAYAIHKSFIFVRVPLTAAILPKVVRVLRSWGWKIGKRKGSP